MAYVTQAQATAYIGVKRPASKAWTALDDAGKTALLDYVSNRFDALPWTDAGTTPRYADEAALQAAPIVEAAFYICVAEYANDFDATKPNSAQTIGQVRDEPVIIHPVLADLPFAAQAVLQALMTLPIVQAPDGDVEVVREKVGAALYERRADGTWEKVADESGSDPGVVPPDVVVYTDDLGSVWERQADGAWVRKVDKIARATRAAAPLGEHLNEEEEAAILAEIADFRTQIDGFSGEVLENANAARNAQSTADAATRAVNAEQQARIQAIADLSRRLVPGGSVTAATLAAILGQPIPAGINPIARSWLVNAAGGSASVNPRWTQAQTDFFSAIREPHIAGAVVFIPPYDGIFKVKSGEGTEDAIAAGTLAEGTVAQGTATGTPNVLITTPLNQVRKILVLENLRGNDSTLISLEVPNLNGVGFSRLPYFFRAMDDDGKMRYFFRNLDGGGGNTATGIEAMNGDSLAISETAASGDPTAEQFVISVRRAGENEEHAQNTVTAIAGTLTRARFNRVLVPSSGLGAFRSWSAVAIIHHAGAYVSHSTLGLIDLVHAGDYYGIASVGPGSDKLQFTRALDFTTRPTFNGKNLLVEGEGGGSGKNPSFIRASWFGGGRVNAPAENNIQFATPVGVERAGVGGGAKTVVANGGALGAGITFTAADGYRAKRGRGFSLSFQDTDEIIDFTTIGFQIDVDRGSATNAPNNDIVGAYFGADIDPTGRAQPTTTKDGLYVALTQGRYVQVIRMDTRQWLTAAGAWSNAQFTAVKDLGADGVITGEFELSIGYSKGLLILRAGETELANVLLPSAPNLTGDRFGIQADYEAGGFADPDGYVGIQGFAIHDLTPEVIDPHSHAASGGDTPAPAASEWTTLYKAASYNNAADSADAALSASVKGHTDVRITIRNGAGFFTNTFPGDIIDAARENTGVPNRSTVVPVGGRLRIGGADYAAFTADNRVRAILAAGGADNGAAIAKVEVR